MMKSMILSAAVLAVASTGAFAQCNLDQDAATNNAFMAAFSQPDLAQSFQHQVANSICGAGIFLQPGVGSTDNVTIELWTTLPNGGGNMLATGSAQGTAGSYVDVTWSPVAISANTTYFLHFTGNTTLGISGDVNNGYPFGQVYANSGFGSFPGFDYTFRTTSGSAGLGLTLSGSCPGPITVSWSGATPNKNMGIVFASNTGNFTIPGGPCGGTTLGLGTRDLRLVNTISTGSGSGRVNGNAGTPACGGYLQLVVIEGSPCTTSNVAQIL